MTFPISDVGGKLIASGDFSHVADATPAFFTHWSTLVNIGTVTITVQNESTALLHVKITRFTGADIDIDIDPTGITDNNRSVTVPGAKSLMIQEDPAVTVDGDYIIVQH